MHRNVNELQEGHCQRTISPFTWFDRKLFKVRSKWRNCQWLTEGGELGNVDLVKGPQSCKTMLADLGDSTIFTGPVPRNDEIVSWIAASIKNDMNSITRRWQLSSNQIVEKFLNYDGTYGSRRRLSKKGESKSQILSYDRDVNKLRHGHYHPTISSFC